SLGRRPGVGPAARRALARRARVGAARAGPRVARPGLPDPRGAHRAQRRRAAPGGPPAGRRACRSRRARRGAAGGAAMRRVLLGAAVALLALALAAPAGAHPLGNFSVNHLTVVRASSDRVDVRYVLDQAEIPTFRERGLAPGRVLERKRAEVARGVTLTVGGRPVALAMRPGGRISFPRGAGGLHNARVELLLSARVALRGAVVIRDKSYAVRVR